MTANQPIPKRRFGLGEYIVFGLAIALLLILIAGAIGLRYQFVTNGVFWDHVNGRDSESYWSFRSRNQDFVFAIMSTDRSASSLRLGAEGTFSDDVVFLPFGIGTNTHVLSVFFNRETQTVKIENTTYRLADGNMFRFQTVSGTIVVEQSKVVLGKDVIRTSHAAGTELHEELHVVSVKSGWSSSP